MEMGKTWEWIWYLKLGKQWKLIWKKMKIFGKTIIWKIMVILVKNWENRWEKLDNSLDMRKMIEHCGKFWYMAYGDGSGTYNWLVYCRSISRNWTKYLSTRDGKIWNRNVTLEKKRLTKAMHSLLISSFIILHHPSSSFIILHHPSSSFIILHHPSSSFIILYHHLSSFIIIYHHLSPMNCGKLEEIWSLGISQQANIFGMSKQ